MLKASRYWNNFITVIHTLPHIFKIESIEKNEDLQNLLSLWKERNEKEFSWVKQVISIISIILGLIISLKSKSSKDLIEYTFFIVAISINGLCVLSGLIFLYSETDTVHSLILRYTKHIKSPSNSGKQTLIQVEPKKIYDILRILFFILLFLSILSLIAFGAYSSLPNN